LDKNKLVQDSMSDKQVSCAIQLVDCLYKILLVSWALTGYNTEEV